MAERTEYAPGTPNWVDLQTSDQAAAKRFYTALFGWDYDDQPFDDNAVYSMGTIRGKHVAAIAPLPPQQGIPPHWNTYVAAADVDATVGRVSSAGGNVVMPPMDVMDAGRMAVI
jgi:predicted enzyme related to lactoylglutathione lyase